MKRSTYMKLAAVAVLAVAAMFYGDASPLLGLGLVTLETEGIDWKELKRIIEEQGRAFEEFSNTQTARLGELEKKLNRPNLGGGGWDAGTHETPEQRKALEQFYRAFIAGDPTKVHQHLAELKGMSVGVDPDGGYVVSPTYSDTMTTVYAEVAPFVDLARTVELTQGDRFEEPVDNGTADAQWVSELGTRSDTTAPKLKLFECPVHELYAMPKTSQKLIDTARIGVVPYLEGKVAEAFALKESEAFYTGNGVGKPHGFLAYPTEATADATRAWGTLEHVVTGANGAFAASNPSDILIDLMAKLKPQYRAGAVWQMNRATAAVVRKFKDGQGQYIWAQGLLAGQPSVLLGYPVVEAEQMPDISTGSLSIAFGNFKKGYSIVRKLGVRLLADPYTDKPNVRLYAIERVGGGVNNSEAIKLLKFSA
jgi:HK97 family phage major capsid protein